MRGFFMMLFMGLGYLLQFGGGFALMGLFIYGVYTLFATSIAGGLMMIGGAVVGGWVIQIISGLLIAAGVGAATIGVKDE
jgi:hypothetical protein